MVSRKILVIGGARSGKSSYAQELALQFPQPVLFVATAEAGDEEMRQRIEEHKKLRPHTWKTVEASAHVGRQIEGEIGTVQTIVIDCITLLIGNICSRYTDANGEPTNAQLIEREAMTEIKGLVDCLDQVEASFIVVSNEVGLGLVPANTMSRLYRDLLGRANQTLAQCVDEVYLMVAGLPVRIKPAGNW